MSHCAVMWEMLEVLWGSSHKHVSPLQLSRCADAAHTRSWSCKFMICSYWGIHTFIRREVFHLLVWCSFSLGNRRSRPVCFLSMERRCVPKKSCTAINQSSSLQEESESCAGLPDLFLQQTLLILFRLHKSKTAIHCVKKNNKKI